MSPSPPLLTLQGSYYGLEKKEESIVIDVPKHIFIDRFQVIALYVESTIEQEMEGVAAFFLVMMNKGGGTFSPFVSHYLFDVNLLPHIGSFLFNTPERAWLVFARLRQRLVSSSAT